MGLIDLQGQLEMTGDGNRRILRVTADHELADGQRLNAALLMNEHQPTPLGFGAYLSLARLPHSRLSVR